MFKKTNKKKKQKTLWIFFPQESKQVFLSPPSVLYSNVTMSEKTLLAFSFWTCPQHVEVLNLELNLRHSSDPNRCSDVRFLTHWATRGFLLAFKITTSPSARFVPCVPLLCQVSLGHLSPYEISYDLLIDLSFKISVLLL